MSNLAIRVMPEPVRSLAALSIGAGYIGIGSAFANPVHLFVIQNFTDEPIMTSWDGINDHLPLAANGYIVIDVSSNKTLTGGSFMVAQGTRFYAKALGAVPTTGNVYVSVFYGYNG